MFLMTNPTIFPTARILMILKTSNEGGIDPTD